MRLCHVSSSGCRRLFARLFASTKGIYAPPADPWEQQTSREVLLRCKASPAAPAAAAAAAEAPAAAETTVRCPPGAPLWQMPALVLQQTGLVALQHPPQQKHSEVAAASAAAAAAAAAEGATPRVVPM